MTCATCKHQEFIDIEPGTPDKERVWKCRHGTFCKFLEKWVGLNDSGCPEYEE